MAAKPSQSESIGHMLYEKKSWLGDIVWNAGVGLAPELQRMCERSSAGPEKEMD